MSDFKYSEAQRCGACSERAIIPDEADADQFVLKSEGSLLKVECVIGNGWHLVYPKAELTSHA